MNYTSAYILAALGTVLVLFWMFLYVRYHNLYDEMLIALDSKKFLMPELYFIGMGVIDLFKINLKTTRGRRQEKKIAEIYGQRYAEFYHFCILGGQITMALTMLPIGMFLGAMANNNVIALLAVVATVAIVAYLDMDINNSINKKRDEIILDYPNVLSKLTLLINAGMVVREAWEKVAYTSDRAIYKEMQVTSDEMRNGMSDIDALYNFSQRCAVKEIRKFSSILSQNIQKGGSELAASLKYMNDESWEEKKNTAKRMGELAGQKLMLPLMIMFVGILFMIIVPIFTNMF